MPNQAKTLHLTNSFHESSGGVATSYRALLREADKNGRLMRLVVPSDRDGVEEIGKFGRIYHVAAPRSRFFDTRYRTILPQRYLLTRQGRIWEILAAEQPDLLEVRDKLCLNWLGGLFRKSLQRVTKRPVLVASSSERLDDLLAAYLAGIKPVSKLARVYMRYCYIPLFDFHTANSPYTADEIRAAMVSKHARPLVVFPEGVDCDRFTPHKRDRDLSASLLRRVAGTEDSLLLLYCGRLSPEKNLRLLVEVMNRLNEKGTCDFRLVVAGDGPMAPHLRREFEAVARGRHVFLGHVSDRDELARLYASCDIFVHPNPREPFGIAPLEAMASGLALVAPDSGGVLSYADLHSSWLVPPDAASFANAIVDASDPELRRQRSAAARKVAERFNWPIIANRLFDLFDHLVDHQSGAALVAGDVGFTYG
ncbi:MAG TPA: glycosyltransferase [Blastocatellia bacterium]